MGLKLVSAFCLSLCPVAALARESTGPESNLSATKQSMRTFVRALAPIETGAGRFVPVVSYFNERARERPKDAVHTKLDAIAAGLIYFPAVSLFGTDPLVGYSQYTSTDLKAKPMHEVLLGATALDTPVRFDDSDVTTSRLVLRVRRFPGGNRLLPFLFHKVEMQSGWVLDVSVPSFAFVGYRISDDQFVNAGAVFTGLDFPTENASNQPGWIEGNTLSVQTSFRQRLFGIFHLQLSGGMQNEKKDFVLNETDKATQNRGGFEPFVAVGLKTIVIN